MTQQVAKRVTLTKVANRLGLSPATISLVLNGRSKQYGICKATAEVVRAEVKKMNYRPSIAARQLLGKHSGVVGVLINTQAEADPRLIQKMEVLAAERGVRFMVGHAVGTHDRVKDYLADFLARGVDGVISIFHNHPDYKEAVLGELARFERVVYYEKPGNDDDAMPAGACYVAPDYYAVGRLGVEHLIDRRRQRIALVLNDLVFPYARVRHRAYQDALKAAGRRVDERLIWVMDRQPSMRWTEPFTPDRAMQVVDDVVIAGGADGIVVVDDIYAARIIAALRRRGLRVPDDVAVVGCNDLDVSTMIEPELTTVNLQVDKLARAMVELLFTLLDHGSVPEVRRAVIIRPELVVRNST